jgi:hypothetical protein
VDDRLQMVPIGLEALCKNFHLSHLSHSVDLVRHTSNEWHQPDVTGDLDEAGLNEKSRALVPGAVETACQTVELDRDGQSVGPDERPNPATSRFELNLVISRKRFRDAGQRARLPSMSSCQRYDGDRS